MDVPKSRFAAELVNILQNIADSHFIAFDLEFSGVAEHRLRRVPGKPTLQQLYEEIKGAADKYQVLQVGLTIVKEDVEKGEYTILPYNFNICPIPTLRERQFSRNWTMNSGAVAFLLRNRFNFGLPLTDGIPYLSRNEEKRAYANIMEEQTLKRPDMEIQPQDEPLIKHIRSSIADWQDQPLGEQERYINIPSDKKGRNVPGSLNRYQIRLTHQIVQNEFPGFKSIGMQHFVQLTKPSAEEVAYLKDAQIKATERELSQATGFRWLLEAIAGHDISKLPHECLHHLVPKDTKPADVQPWMQNYLADLNTKLQKRRSVLVGHNCFTDLVNLYKFYDGSLPDSVEHFQDNIRDLFPAIIDTKHIASFGSARWGDTSLAAVEEDLRSQDAPKTVIPSQFDRYRFNESQHEAGYDSLLTANIVIKLSARMEREGSWKEQDTPAPKPRDTATHFGVQESDGYVTASEKLDSESNVSSNISTSRPILPETPTTATQSTFAATSSHNASNDAASSSDVSNLLVVKERKKKPKAAGSISGEDVAKLKNPFANNTIYDILGDEPDATATNDDDLDGTIDLISFSDEDLSKGESHITVDEMIKKGQLMPRWDGGNEFWKVFGNVLQVNGCREGECRL